MPTKIGVRELKNRTSQIVRTIREEMADYVITVRGEPVAILRPLTEEDTQQLHQRELDNIFVEMKALAQEVANAWTSPKSALELVEEQRR